MVASFQVRRLLQHLVDSVPPLEHLLRVWHPPQPQIFSVSSLLSKTEDMALPPRPVFFYLTFSSHPPQPVKHIFGTFHVWLQLPSLLVENHKHSPCCSWSTGQHQPLPSARIAAEKRRGRSKLVPRHFYPATLWKYWLLNLSRMIKAKLWSID